MFVSTQRQLQAVAAVAGLLGIGGVGWAAAQSGGGGASVSPPTAVAPDPGSAATSTTALVFVSGAVRTPGLYRLSPDARVADAIAAAGGLLPTADGAKLPDMAERVHDGRQINVPWPKPAASRAPSLDVNAAEVDELAAVAGMPEGLPQAIVEYRAAWGPFASLAVMGKDLEIDPATMKALSASLRVGT